MNKTVKRILIAAVAVLSALLLVVAVYVGYVVFTYSRIADDQPLSVTPAADSAALKTGETYTAYIHNLGFGAYTPDFTFFMDGGTQSWAESEESVERCITASADLADACNPDFILFQEVDTDSTRSYHVNQRELLETRFAEYGSVFAVNYHSAFLMYPFHQPHGASNSGLLTLSKYTPTAAVRRQLPISDGFGKFLDLDRCYSVTRIPVENGKELVLYNVHSSAYGSDDAVRTAQMTMLFADMKREYDAGNYCVCGGDFNHDFTGDSTQKLNGGATAEFGWAQPFPEQLLPKGISRCVNYDTLVPTCRNCDVPYQAGNFTIITDGFLVSDNVTTVKVQNRQTNFAYSDHNPVLLQFELKE